MSARLVPLTPGSSPSILVQRPVVLVGRHPESDVRIDSPQISRRHCCLALAYDRVVIRDLGSRNGLWVNGQRLEESLLSVGDEVAIGPFLYRVEDPDAPPPPRPFVGASAAPAADAPARPEAAEKPPSLPFLPIDPGDPEGDLVPIDL